MKCFPTSHMSCPQFWGGPMPKLSRLRTKRLRRSAEVFRIKEKTLLQFMDQFSPGQSNTSPHNQMDGVSAWSKGFNWSLGPSSRRRATRSQWCRQRIKGQLCLGGGHTTDLLWNILQGKCSLVPLSRRYTLSERVGAEARRWWLAGLLKWGSFFVEENIDLQKEAKLEFSLYFGFILSISLLFRMSSKRFCHSWNPWEFLLVRIKLRFNCTQHKL